MALIRCGECGREVSTTAKVCPQCGAKVKKPKKPVSKITALFVLAFVVFVVYRAMTSNQELEDKQSAEAARIAALTPEQRTRAEAERSKRDAQLNAGASGALVIKHAAKDPEAFELRRAVVKVDGATCYE